jgi:hypothetical protein
MEPVQGHSENFPTTGTICSGKRGNTEREEKD